MRRACYLLHLALCLLLPASCDWRGGHYERLLCEAEEMNRHDSLFTSDSLGLALVRHYDHWWHTRNHRLRAYYMLGCAYRDMGEAPAALHYYHIATEQADTAAADCDFATLFRVYGQMAMVYGYQNMPLEKKEALIKYSHYAWLAHDTLNHIIAYEQMTDVCCQLDDTLGVFAYTDSASVKYMKYGYPHMAVSAYPTAIYTCILNKNYPRARRYMDIFEQESGLFDENGNIASGREHYYNSKGLYYLGTGKTDSAEYYFRRLLPYGYQIEACEGLLSIYEERKNADSIAKYAALYKEAQVKWASSRQSSAIIQSSAMYRYERNQNLAAQKAQEASRAKSFSWFIALASALAFALFYIAYSRAKARSRRKEQEYDSLEKQYENKTSEYQKLIKEYTILRHTCDASDISIETERLLEEKEGRIRELETELGWYMDKSGVLDILEKEERIRKEEIVTFFEEKTLMVKGWKAPSEKKWGELSDIYKQYFPLAFPSIADMPRQERYTCILTHIGFSTGMAAILLETSSQRITNVKRKANHKLAGDSSAPTLIQTLRNLAKGVN